MTGQAEGIAEEIYDRLNQKCIKCELISMHDGAKKGVLDIAKIAIFVTSSTGDGDPPDNAGKFFKELKNHPGLNSLKYTLLGLGDSNYTTFLGFPKDLKKALDEKGATLFYEPGWADDAVGLEIVVDPWIEGFLPALENCIKGKPFKPIEVAAKPDEHFLEKPEMVKEELEEQKLTGEGGVVINGDAGLKRNGTLSLEEEPPALELVLEPSVQLVPEEPFVPVATLKFSPKLKDEGLKVPASPRSKLQIKFGDSIVKAEFQPESSKQLQSATGPVAWLPVTKVRRLTTPDAEKCALEITLDKEGNGFNCEPGDAIGIICPNDPEEVQALIERLGCKEVADKCLEIVADPKDIPAHFPSKSSLRSLLLYHLDIRTSPKKLLLRVLADYTTDDSEKRRLLELSSINGAGEYMQLIKEESITLLDILELFPSCHPPVEKVLEQLPKLLSRAYSVITSKLKDPNHVAFVYKIVEFSKEKGRRKERQGVATGWMSNLTRHLWQNVDLEEKLGKLAVEPVKLPVYPRTNTSFRLPETLETPIIMVGPGSGVAPFLGFLHQREELTKRNPTATIGSSWLFFGCRHEKRDYLYRTELERLQNSGVLNRFYVAFSREPVGGPKYVQDAIFLHKRPIVHLLLDKGAVFYVCGDAKGMAKGVYEAVANSIAEVKGLEISEARKILVKIQTEKRYLQDVWA